MKKLILAIMLIASSTCFSADTYYMTIYKPTANEMFVKLAKDNVKIIEVKNLDYEIDGQLLLSYQFPELITCQITE